MLRVVVFVPLAGVGLPSLWYAVIICVRHAWSWLFLWQRGWLCSFAKALGDETLNILIRSEPQGDGM